MFRYRDKFMALLASSKNAWKVGESEWDASMAKNRPLLGQTAPMTFIRLWSPFLMVLVFRPMVGLLVQGRQEPTYSIQLIEPFRWRGFRLRRRAKPPGADQPTCLM